MEDGLSLDELSARTGAKPEDLLVWQAAGLLGAGSSDHFPNEAAGRAKIVALLVRRGLSIDSILLAEERQPFMAYQAERIFGDRLATALTLAEVAERGGVERTRLDLFVRAGNLGYEGGWLDAEDVGAIKGMVAVLNAGLPEEALLQALRVFSDTAARAAEGAQRAFHTYVHERMRAAGMSVTEATEASGDVAKTTSVTLEPAMLYFLRKANARALLEDVVVHAAEAAGVTDVPSVLGEIERAIMFVDLSSYTPLTEAMGDLTAADVLERFSLLVRGAVQDYQGRVIKQNGDAFMVVFPSATEAVEGALALDERCSSEPQFPAARSGVHWGKVLYREADYIGSSVNVASRVQAEAQRHQTLVTAATRNAARDAAGVEFVRLGKRKLKGVSEEVELYEVRRPGEARSTRTIDPVCGMELGAGEVAARLTLDGVERTFCSDGCLRQFVAAPERYP